MKDARFETSSDVVRWLQSEAAGLWPALLGSLSFRRSPACARIVRPVCRGSSIEVTSCTAGRRGGGLQSTCPKSLCPRCSADWITDVLLQELLQQAAPRYLKALKRERAKAPKSKKS